MKHQLALVTGATSGIGMELARLLAAKGISLILSGTNHDRLMQIKAELESKVSVITIAADLNVDNERQKLIKLIQNHTPDLVINNAGFGLYGDILSYTTAEQMSILEVNGNAVLEITIEAARALVAYGRKGVILNVASAAAFQLIPGLTVYAATKEFVVYFSQAFDVETEPQGVRVLVTCPGMVDTQFAKRAGGEQKSKVGVMTPKSVAENIWEQIEKQKPISIIDWRYRLMTFISGILPRRWLAKRLQKQIADRNLSQ